MNRKQLIFLTALGVLFGVSLIKATTELVHGHFTSTLVMPFVMAAIVAEQLVSKFAASLRVSAGLKLVRVGGVIVALALLVLTGIKGT